MDFLKKYDFLFFCAGLLVFFFLFGGGISTTAYILMALISGVFFVWHNYIAKSTDRVTYWAKNLLLCFYITFFIAYMGTSVPNEGLNMLIGLGVLVLTFFVSSHFFRKPKRVILFFRLLVIFAIYSTLYGFYIYLGFGFDRFAGFFTALDTFDGFYPNAWVDFVLLCAPPALYLSVSRSTKSPLDRMLGLGALILMLSSYALTFSRGGWLTAGAMIVIAFFLYWWARSSSGFRWRHVFVTLGKLLLVVAFSGAIVLAAQHYRSSHYEINSFISKAALQANEERSSVDERLQFFEGSVKLLQQRPWIGFGPYSFRSMYPQLQTELLSHSSHPHNFVYKLAVEIGLIGVVIIFVFMAIGCSIVHFALKYSEKDTWAIKFMVTLSIFGVVLHNLIDYNFNFLIITFLTAIMMGIIFGITVPRDKEQIDVRYGWHYKMLILIILGHVIVGGHEAYHGYFLKQARALPQEDAIARIPLLEKADRLWQKRDVPVELTKAYIATGAYEQAEKYASKEALRHNHYAELWYFWGEALAHQKRFPEAAEKYMYAIEKDPLNDVRFYEGLVRALQESGDIERLNTWRPRIETILDDYMRKLERNAHFTILTPNPKAAFSLYMLFDQPEKAEQIQKLYEDEVQKMETRYDMPVTFRHL